MISTDVLKGIPHIVILKSETDIRLVEFTGPDAMEKAHFLAQEHMVNDFPGCITVAARVRQIYPMRFEHLAS